MPPSSAWTRRAMKRSPPPPWRHPRGPCRPKRRGSHAPLARARPHLRQRRDQLGQRTGPGIGGVGAVALDLFDGFGYAALGHLHGRQGLSRTVRYRGRRCPTLFRGRPHQGRLPARNHRRRARPGGKDRLAAGARARRPARELADLLAAAEYEWAEDAYCQITLTDAERPANAMETLRRASRHPGPGLRPGRRAAAQRPDLQSAAGQGPG